MRKSIASAKWRRGNGTGRMIEGAELTWKAAIGRRARLLVVDDEAQVRKVRADILANEGYESHSVGNGEEALAAIKKEKPDAMLLDINLPGMDGFKVLEAIRLDSLGRTA